MSATKRLVIFDVDGTLVDSQDDIYGAMTYAFDAIGEPAPSRQRILSIVGLSLDPAMKHLAPDLPESKQAQMIEFYKEAYMHLRRKSGAAQSSPLYPGAMDTLIALHGRKDIVLGVATGKSRRGLDKLFEAHDIGHMFATQQVSDNHPSKPHPSMILQALDDTGISPENAVMIGDTSFDMSMAQAAGIFGIGVTWGYHSKDVLTAATRLVHNFGGLSAVLDGFWQRTLHD